MKIAWLHNFDPKIKGAAPFMYVLFEELKAQGADVDLIYVGNLRSFRKIIFGISRKLKKITKQYDILHAQFGSACGYVVSKLPGRKIVSFRGSDWYGTSSGSIFYRCHGLLQRWLTRRSVKNVSDIVVMSKKMELDVVEKTSAKLHIIPDGIDLDFFNPIEKTKARKLLGVADDNSPWILFPTFQSNNHIKRPALARAAFIEAKKNIPNLKLKEFSGIPHEKMPLLYSASDLILMTSTHEGWPNTIKEALACNLPFVSTDVSDLKMIANKEPSCHVVEEADPVALGKAIVDALNTPKPTNLRKHVEQMDVRVVAKKMIGLYEEILSRDG